MGKAAEEERRDFTASRGGSIRTLGNKKNKFWNHRGFNSLHVMQYVYTQELIF